MNTSLPTLRPLALLFLLACLVACGSTHPKTATRPSPKPSPSASPSPSPSPSPTVPEPALPPVQAGPLPGQTLPLSGPLAETLLIQVENTAPARPQAGLGAAAVVFQYLTEGGITRMSALFHRVPGVVGPVRSVRFSSVALYQRMGAVQMGSGGSAPVLDRITASGIGAFINDFDGGKHFFRWGGRVAPHNLYTSQAQMIDASNRHYQPPKSDDFARSTTWAGTTPAAQVDIPADRLTFNYAGGTYDVVSDGSEETDMIYGVLHPHSVVVMHVKQWVTNMCPPGHGCLMDYDLASGGAAEFYANGTEQTGGWSPASNGPRTPLVFTDASGAVLALPPGLMWVVLAP